LLHRKPCHPWTLDELAVEVGASRSVLVERFTRFLGEPPLTYLASWRMQLAARLLQTTRKTVIELALDVGYESEAAFNRAFKREFGLPPAQYRKRLAGNGARAAQGSHGLNDAPSSQGIEQDVPDAGQISSRRPL
jgi:AraC-like DNA-binding protein